MQDLDWYLDLGGKKSGPFAVEDIIARYKNGEIPTSAYVTAQRMKGEWVRITDLIEAYRDLFQVNDGPSLTPIASSSLPPAPQQTKTNIPRPPAQNTSSIPLIESTSPRIDRPSSSRFQAPPRPTEQLEASKLITLNPPGAGSNHPDATESLFQAIQAIREKNQMKTHPPSRDSWGELSRPKKMMPPQSSLYLVLIGIMLAAAYATYKIVLSRKTTVEEQAALRVKSGTPAPAAPSHTPPPSGKLLNDPATASGAVTRPAPPKSKSLNSPAGGNIRLSTPTRIDDEEESRPAHDEDEGEDMISPDIEEGPDLSQTHATPNTGINGSYPVDSGGYETEAPPPDGSQSHTAGAAGQRPPGEGAIDPNTGNPVGP